MRVLQDHLDGRTPFYEAEHRVRTKGGEGLWISDRGKVVARDAQGQPMRAVGTHCDISRRKAAEVGLALVNDELHHRVKNTLATVQAVAASTARSAPDLDAFTRTFSARLGALAKTHALLFAGDANSADLRSLLLGELGPYDDGLSHRFRLDGPAVALPTAVATPFGMAIHELATNAAKHGALSIIGGTVEVSWSLTGKRTERRLQLRWDESGGPEIAAAPTRRGFGTQFLERVFAAQCNATVACEFAVQGLKVSIDLPLPG